MACNHVGTWSDEGTAGAEARHDFQATHESDAKWRTTSFTLLLMI
jgi:hypothetical protein